MAAAAAAVPAYSLVGSSARCEFELPQLTGDSKRGFAVGRAGRVPADVHPNAILVDSPAVRGLFSRIRDKTTERKEFAVFMSRLMTLLAEEALYQLPGTEAAMIETPCGHYRGLSPPPEDSLVVVSILRSGDILLDAFERLVPGLAIGKILIQRDEHSAEKSAHLYYSKLPPDTSSRVVVLVDPMLATGGSVIEAIKVLRDKGVPEDRILFVNVIAAPEGLQHLAKAFPGVRVVTAAIDSHLNADKYIVPGLGDAGDRFYGT